MRITIIGSGYVGLVTGACLADAGNHVLCMDKDATKVQTLRGGGIPIYEPGLEQLVRDNAAAGRLTFTDDLKEGVAHGEVLFIAVPTPPDEDGAADVGHVLAAARAIAACMEEEKLVVNKSTAPVGTVHRARDAMAEELARRGKEIQFTVVSNPEFLKEGAAVEDFMKPDRIIIGVDGEDDGSDKARRTLAQLYAPFNRNRRRMLVMDARSAELTKYAANAMLATKISFINEMAALAEILGADIEHVRQGIGADRRIGHHFIYPGCGYGGSCLPKDVQALRRTAAERNFDARILAAVSGVNHEQKTMPAKKIAAHFHLADEDEGWKKLRFALWGLAFKPNTDDVREAPAIALARCLLARGARVNAFDPAANATAKKALAGDGDGLHFYDDPYAALDGCDALLALTEWKVFHNPDLERMTSAMRGRVVFDGRNIYHPRMFSAAGFTYYGIGRPA